MAAKEWAATLALVAAGETPTPLVPAPSSFAMYTAETRAGRPRYIDLERPVAATVVCCSRHKVEDIADHPSTSFVGARSGETEFAVYSIREDRRGSVRPAPYRKVVAATVVVWHTGAVAVEVLAASPTGTGLLSNLTVYHTCLVASQAVVVAQSCPGGTGTVGGA